MLSLPMDLAIRIPFRRAFPSFALLLFALAFLISGCGGGGGNSGANSTVEFRILARVPTVGHNLYKFTLNNLESTIVGPSFNLSELAGITQRDVDGFLYTYGTDNDSIFSFDPDTGEMFLHGSSGVDLPFAEYGMDIDPISGEWRMMSVENNERISVLDTSHIASETPPTPSTDIQAIAFTPSSGNPGTTTLYGIDQGNVNLCRIGGVNGTPSPNDGEVEIIGPLGISNELIQGFEIATNGKAYLLTVRQGDNAIFLYTVNLSTGAATQIGQVEGEASPFAGEIIGFCLVERQAPSP